MDIQSDSWKTKPSDRFVLKWIKRNLSARITPRLVPLTWLKPWMITVGSSLLGVTAGVTFAFGAGVLAGFLAMVSQIFDGVDGQFARLTGKQSAAGAFLDSVLDRYSDGAMLIGLFIYLLRLPIGIPLWQMLILAALALIGSNLISYSSSRADSLNLDLGKPTLASKGTRMSVMIVSGLGSFFLAPLPLAALVYLAIHPNLTVVYRIYKSLKPYRNK